MNAEKARLEFERAIAAAKLAGNAEAVAKLELVREYFCNPAFRVAMQNYVYEING